MKFAVAIASSILQAYFVLGFIGFLTGLIKTFQVASIYNPGDPKLVAGAISQEIIVFMFFVIPGLLGAFLSWFVLRRLSYRPRWFTSLVTAYASAWIIIFPTGTILGIFMLRWKKGESRSEAAT